MPRHPNYTEALGLRITIATGMTLRVSRCGKFCRVVGVLILALAARICHAQTAFESGTPLADSRFYVQLQTGLASESDFLPSLFFITDQSKERTFYDGVSIGTLLGSSIFGYKAEVVGYFGLQNFRERGFQPDSYGATIYWKVYGTWGPSWLPTTLPIRAGLGQGLSYASRIPVAEQRDFEPRESAETVHYLEWTVQVPVSGLLALFGVDALRGQHQWWIGYSIFHRSTVFGAFGDSPGGINYPGITLEYVFHR